MIRRWFPWGLALVVACSTPEAPPFADVLRTLEESHGPSRVESTFEVLAPLAPYFDDADVTTGVAAAERHYASLAASARRDFASRLRWTLVYSDLFELLGTDLPNGVHDVGLTLPESRPLYDGVVDAYGLEPGQVTPYSVATSLSTADDVGLVTALAWLVAGLPDEDRADYLQRFVDRAREVRSTVAP